MSYTIYDDWLLLNGEKVLFCENYTSAQMETICNEYNLAANALKHPIIFPKRVPREVYTNEADPLFFKEQRGEVPIGTWLAKVAEIRSRYE